MNSLFIGIDVSSTSNVVYFMNPDGSKHSSFSVQNSPKGAIILSNKVLSAMDKGSFDNCIIGLEATSVYGDNLVYFLKQDAALSKIDKHIHILNPKQVKKFKDAYSDLPKNDYVDSFIIADNLRFGRITKEVYMDDYRYKALQNLTRSRFLAVENLSKEKQRFLNYLFLKFSALKQSKVFSDIYGAASLAVIEEFMTLDDIADANLNDLAAFIMEKGKNRFADSKAVAKALKSAANASYRLPKTVNDSVNQVMAISISSMRAMQMQIKAFDKAIKEQIKLIPNTLESIPGFGPVYTAGIIAEIGDINRFSNQAALAKYAGLVWTQHQSGNFEAQNTRLIKSGNRYLRYYLIEAANSVRRHDSEYARFYNLKYKEVNKYQHKRALALTARKLVRLVYKLLKTNQLYIPSDR